MLRNAAILLAYKVILQAGEEFSEPINVQVKRTNLLYEIDELVGQANQPDGKKILQPAVRAKGNTDWQNMLQLNRIIYQAVVAQHPLQIATISYNESKDRFLYRLYRPHDSSTIERRFDGTHIQRTCAPHYLHMVRNQMEQKLGKRICRYFHANLLVASMLEIHKMNALNKDYDQLGGGLAVLTSEKTVALGNQRRPSKK